MNKWIEDVTPDIQVEINQSKFDDLVKDDMFKLPEFKGTSLISDQSDHIDIVENRIDRQFRQLQSKINASRYRYPTP